MAVAIQALSVSGLASKLTGLATSGGSVTGGQRWAGGMTYSALATALGPAFTAGSGGVTGGNRLFSSVSGLQAALIANGVFAQAVAGVAPAFSARPVITGSTGVGQTLTVTPGTVTGTPAPTITRQWFRNGVALSGSTGLTYVIQAGDVNTTLTVTETATNTAGSDVSTSTGLLIPEVPVLPANTALPTISGTATVGQTMTATLGTWTGTPTPTLAYQWQRGTTNISGATNNLYTLQSADVGATVRVVVTATNAAGTVAANSANSAVVQAVSTAPTFVPANQSTVDVFMAVNTTGTPINAAGWFTGTVSSYALVEALPGGPGIPAGITINSATGVITLTPTIDGETYVQVAATNGGATAYSDGIRISIHP